MSDINITLGSDNSELKKDVKESNKILQQQRRTQERLDKRLSRKKARNRLKGIRTENKALETQRKTNERLDKRLERRKAKNRLRAIRERVRAEKTAIREIERAQRIASQRRARLSKIAIGAGIGAGVALGAIGVRQGRKLLEFSRDVAFVAGQAKISTSAQANLKSNITDTSIQKGVKRDDLLIAIGTLIDDSGNIALATEGMGRIAEILVGSPTSPEDLGKGLAALDASLKGQGKTTKELIDIFEVAVAQGDIGSVNTAALAQSGEKIFGAILTKGFATKEGIIGTGALLQTAATGATTEGAVTNFKAFLDAMIANQGKLAKAGFDPLTKGGFFKPIDELVAGITSIKSLFSGDKVNQKVLKKLVPEKKARDLFSLLAQQSLLGDDAPFQQFFREGSEAGGNFDAKFQRLSKEGSTQFTRLGNLGSKLGEKTLEPIIADLTDTIEKLLKDPAALKQLEDTFRAFGDLLVLAGKGVGLGVKTGQTISNIVKNTGPGAIIQDAAFLAQLVAKKTGLISDPIQADKNFALNLQINNNQDGTADVEVQSLFNGDRGGKKITKSIRNGTTGSF